MKLLSSLLFCSALFCLGGLTHAAPSKSKYKVDICDLDSEHDLDVVPINLCSKEAEKHFDKAKLSKPNYYHQYIFGYITSNFNKKKGRYVSAVRYYYVLNPKTNNVYVNQVYALAYNGADINKIKVKFNNKENQVCMTNPELYDNVSLEYMSGSRDSFSKDETRCFKLTKWTYSNDLSLERGPDPE